MPPVVDYRGLARRLLMPPCFADAAAAEQRYVGQTEMADIKLQIDSPFLVKLLDVVASGIGAVFRPWMIRRLARANADAMLIQAKAEWDARALTSGSSETGDDVQVLVLPSEHSSSPEQRTQIRLQVQEEKRQRNIELVVWQAASDPGPAPSETPLDDDWVARFFGAVQDVSAEELQLIWGKILAGEVRQPGSFSLRTLDHLKNLTRQEAEMLSSVAGCFEERTGVLLFGGAANQILPPLSRLVEAGLLHARSMWKLQSAHPYPLQYIDGSLTATLKGVGFMDRFDATQATAELLSVIERKPLTGYLEALKADLRKAGYVVEDAAQQAVEAGGRASS